MLVVVAGQDAAGEWVQLWHRNLSGIPRPWIAASLVDALTCPDGVALPVITDVEAAWTVTPVTPVQVAASPPHRRSHHTYARHHKDARPSPLKLQPRRQRRQRHRSIAGSYRQLRRRGRVGVVVTGRIASGGRGLGRTRHGLYLGCRHWATASALNPGAQATAMKWSPDGTRLAVGGNVIFDDAVFVWDTSSGSNWVS
ncbi:MAG: hypothetical protein M5R40_19380 [Anaerolineae bacterium]|nr:hypothetical protein [Anaerolineae bacterium]